MLVSLMAGALLLGPPRLDEASLKVVQASRDKLAAASSVSGVLVTETKGKKSTYKFRLMRPNYMDVVSESNEWHSDGTDMYFYYPSRKEYQKSNAQKTGMVLMMYGLEPVVGAKLPEIKEADMAEFGGKKAVRAKLPSRNAQLEMYVFIDPESKMPVGWSQVYGGNTTEFKYADIKLNAKMDAASFAWTPPKDAEPYKQPDFMASLLKEGSEAPDFTNDTPTGGKVGLKETVGKSKALLLNFWFYG
jgi:outer membrane lipoprotein-sorting protein